MGDSRVRVAGIDKTSVLIIDDDGKLLSKCMFPITNIFYLNNWQTYHVSMDHFFDVSTEKRQRTTINHSMANNAHKKRA